MKEHDFYQPTQGVKRYSRNEQTKIHTIQLTLEEQNQTKQSSQVRSPPPQKKKKGDKFTT